ncbi:peptidoglycan-binding protein [Frigidibacter sp. ROC022]|uniref:peptidoglycan-binding protein n=1 Tax=Frigidibacter sp. ROC022 TaxID=2971796 RepID=UPI00215B388A|nr:peptidoglycan-binding protein [Frigidibacter sp. ROC022]MCR8726186.1 peptidoglycan-binding protein [Frigidibacter sp. ROC022]
MPPSGSRAALRWPALLLALAGPALAQDPGRDACYSLPDAADPGTVESLTVTGAGEIALTLPGAPYVRFEFTCPLDDEGHASCGVECDGGNVTLDTEDGRLTADFEHLRFESARIESLSFGLVQFDADGLGFTGRYQLDPAPPEACDGAGQAQPYLLEPGDFYPAVARIESYLAAGGYLAEPPDWYYTAETAAAVAAFQAEVGLPQTGKSDAALLRRLGVFTGYALGGC